MVKGKVRGNGGRKGGREEVMKAKGERASLFRSLQERRSGESSLGAVFLVVETRIRKFA